jgi:hypothetical protein
MIQNFLPNLFLKEVKDIPQEEGATLLKEVVFFLFYFSEKLYCN